MTYQYALCIILELVFPEFTLLRKNHPEAVVYNQSSNELLEHAISSEQGLHPPPLHSIKDGKPLPLMPRRGEVHGICAGKPIPLSFS